MHVGVVDVRRFTRSKRYPWFAGPELASALRASGIAYEHQPDLGGFRRPPEDTTPVAGLAPQWHGYAAYMRAPGYHAALATLLEAADPRGPAAVLCAEREPAHCHRHLLADAVLLAGWSVVHLLRPDEQREHRLHELVRVDEDGLPSYPARQRDLFR